MKEVSSADVFSPSATEPLVPFPVSGLVVVIPEIVPPPAPKGNVWLGLNLITPLEANDNPVAAGVVVPAPNIRARLVVGEAVLLPVTCVCHA